MSRTRQKAEDEAAPNIITDPVLYLDKVFDAIRKRTKEKFDLDFPDNVRGSPGFTEHGKSVKSKLQVNVIFPEATVDGHFEVVARFCEGFDRSIVSDIMCVVPQILAGSPKRDTKCLRLAERWGLDTSSGGLRGARPGKELRQFVEQLEQELGPYPHHGIKFDVLNEKRPQVTTDGKAKQKGRMHKVACDRCGLIVRQSQSAMDDFGIAHCAKHGQMTVHYKEGEEPDQHGEANPDQKPEEAPDQDNAAPLQAAE